jgi:hypothetical protein
MEGVYILSKGEILTIHVGYVYPISKMIFLREISKMNLQASNNTVG